MQYDSADGPASILPDGNVLFDVSPCVFYAPIAFFLYNASSNTLSPVPNIPNAANDSTFYTRMLALPNGQVLFNDGSHQMLVYTAGGTPNPAWAPSIYVDQLHELDPGQSASLSGTQLAGLSQGAAYGDDVQDNTNFPLVRITNRQVRGGHLRANEQLDISLDRARRRLRRPSSRSRRRHRPGRARSSWWRTGSPRSRCRSRSAESVCLPAPNHAMAVPPPLFRVGTA